MIKMSKSLLLGSAITLVAAIAAPHAAQAAMQVAAAPELDPSSALAALTLLSGGLVIARGRWRGKK